MANSYDTGRLNLPFVGIATFGDLLNRDGPFANVAASMGPMALSFWAENRRVRNRLLCQELGYSLRYPSYREGLAALLD